MLTPDQLSWLDILGSDTLREYRDAIINVLAKRNDDVAPVNVVRSNVHVELQHRPHLGRDGDPLAYVTLKSFVIHPTQRVLGDGVMLNHETTRDHLWVEAWWL